MNLLMFFELIELVKESVGKTYNSDFYQTNNADLSHWIR
jgi:hypothetical protein